MKNTYQADLEMILLIYFTEDLFWTIKYIQLKIMYKFRTKFGAFFTYCIVYIFFFCNFTFDT